MNVRTLLVILLGSLFACAHTPSSPLGVWQKERATLLKEYQTTADYKILKKIHAVEDEIVDYIAQNGYKVLLTTQQQDQEVRVTAVEDAQKILTTLKKGDPITIYQHQKKRAFYIKTQEGIKGYITHYDFSPSVNAYPLEVLIAKTKTLEPPTTSSRRGNGSIGVAKGCTSTRCTGQTQRGTRCKRITANCNRRCFQH